MTRRISWTLLSRWCKETLAGRGLAEQERAALADYPQFAAAIRESFELGKAQLAAIEGRGRGSTLGMAVDFWRMFSNDYAKPTD